MSDQGNAAQAAKLQAVNDQYGVAKWELRRASGHGRAEAYLLVTCDDGDRCEIHPDGSVVWRSVSGT